MKLIIYFFCVIAVSAPSLIFSFSYDFAINSAQKGEWEDAHARLNKVIIDNPDNADVLHDAGVVAHKLGNVGQAEACFARAADCAHDDKLRFDALFKGGNASVDNKNLQSALEQYNKALAIKPDDEYARHNRDRVAHMLQQQEKQEQQQNKDEQKNKDQEDKQEQDQQDKKDDEQSGEDKQGDKDQQSGQDKQGNGGQQQDGGQKNDQPGDSDKKSQGDEGNDAESGEKNAQRKEHGNKEKGQKKSADNKERNGDHELDKKSDSKHGKRDKQQGDKHNKTPEKQNETNDATNVAAQGAQEQGKDDDKLGGIGIDDPWLLNVLNNQEKQDKAMNKKLMEAKVSQHGGKNGQNCW